MINPFKMMTQSGRRAVVGELLDKYLDEGFIIRTLAENTTKIIRKRGLDFAKADVIAAKTEKVMKDIRLFGEYAKDGIITFAEMDAIVRNTLDLFGADLATLRGIIRDRAVSVVP